MILWWFPGELLLCGVGIICCFRISGCFAWMLMCVSFDCVGEGLWVWVWCCFERAGSY